MTWTWVEAQKLASEVENHQQWVLLRLQLFLTKMLMQPLCYQSYKLREKGQAHHMFSRFLNLRIFSRIFLCFVFLQGRSFLSRSKIEIKIRRFRFREKHVMNSLKDTKREMKSWKTNNQNKCSNWICCKVKSRICKLIMSNSTRKLDTCKVIRYSWKYDY